MWVASAGVTVAEEWHRRSGVVWENLGRLNSPAGGLHSGWATADRWHMQADQPEGSYSSLETLVAFWVRNRRILQCYQRRAAGHPVSPRFLSIRAAALRVPNVDCETFSFLQGRVAILWFAAQDVMKRVKRTVYDTISPFSSWLKATYNFCQHFIWRSGA